MTRRRLPQAGEGVEGLLNQVGQFGGSVVLDPGEHGRACRSEAGRHGDPGLEAGVRIELVCFEGLEDGLLGGELARPLALAERWGGNDELDLREQVVPVGVVDQAEPLNEHRADPLDEGPVGWGLGDEVSDQGVVAVGQGHVLFGGEVAEERHVRDAGRGRDLLNGGGFVSLLVEQPQRALADAVTGGGLLALPPVRLGFTHKCYRRAPAGGDAAGAGCRGAPEMARPGRYRRLTRAARTVTAAQLSMTMLMPCRNAVPAAARRAEPPDDRWLASCAAWVMEARPTAASLAGSVASAGWMPRV